MTKNGSVSGGGGSDGNGEGGEFHNDFGRRLLICFDTIVELIIR
jgi:hypothetical protein